MTETNRWLAVRPALSDSAQSVHTEEQNRHRHLVAHRATEVDFDDRDDRLIDGVADTVGRQIDEFAGVASDAGEPGGRILSRGRYSRKRVDGDNTSVERDPPERSETVAVIEELNESRWLIIKKNVVVGVDACVFQDCVGLCDNHQSGGRVGQNDELGVLRVDDAADRSGNIRVVRELVPRRLGCRLCCYQKERHDRNGGYRTHGICLLEHVWPQATLNRRQVDPLWWTQSGLSRWFVFCLTVVPCESSCDVVSLTVKVRVMIRRTVYFTGEVQGVFFRATTRDIAGSYDVVGTVRNLRDGRVELIAEGESEEIDGFVSAVSKAKRGFIDEVTSNNSDATGEFSGFAVAL